MKAEERLNLIVTITVVLLLITFYLTVFVFELNIGSDSSESSSEEYSREEVRERIEEYLYEKYDEEFIVDRIGQRRMRDRDFYQARIHPKSIVGTNKYSDDYYYSTASLYKDTGGIGDGYGIVKMNINAEEYLMPKAQEVFGERIKLKPEINYRKKVGDGSGLFSRYLKHDFEKKLNKVRENPEDKRMMIDLDVYVFDRIEDTQEKEERREDIFEFVQYLQDEGLFEYLELGVIFIDERVLADSYDEFEREVSSSNKVREEIEGETVSMPPMDLREEMSRELQVEVDKMSEEELLANMQEIRKDELNYDDLRKYNGQYHTWIYSFGMLEERYSSSITEADKERNYDVIDDIELSRYKKYMFINK